MRMTRNLGLLASLALIQTTAWAQGYGKSSIDYGHHGGVASPPNPGMSAVPNGGRGQGREWTRYPLLVPGMARGAERMAALLRPRGIETTEVQIFAADGPADARRRSAAVGPEGARIEAAAPKLGNYHWVVARSEQGGDIRVASTAWYFSNPGAAPTALLKEVRHELEIVPDPLPREHSAYRESEKWNFLVRFNGVPVANQPVTMDTEFGSRATFHTDAQGRALVLFPRDFKPVSPAAAGGHDHGQRRAKFVLATEREEEGKHYLTAFNLTYSPDADRNRSLAWGVAFGVAGMIAATPLLRRHPAKNGEGENHA